MTASPRLTRDHMPGISGRKRLAEMLRVDHAGEYGAVRIYQGQRAVLARRPATRHSAELIAEMEAQERHHLETFEQLLNERRIRPTALAPLWDVAGFALGAVTALLGEKAAMACTAAVEEVIDDHYTAQLEALHHKDEAELVSLLEDFRADENAHRRTAIEHGAEDAPGYPVLSRLIKSSCRLAIKLSEKI